MDIIDVILGGAFSPKGSISTYAALAQKAVADANTAINNIDTITEQTAANNEAAEKALEDANAALEAVNEALGDLESLNSTIDDEVDNFVFSISTSMTSEAITKDIEITYPSEDVETLRNIIIMYQSSGNKTNGTMTQKAITDYVDSVKNNLQTQINNINVSGGGGGSTNLGANNAGKVVVVGSNGNIIAGSLTEADIITALIKSGSYTFSGIVGLELDYENKTYNRTQDGTSREPGTDFDSYNMFGGRMRCNVADDGTITAWYGDNNYAEDGSNGQVMVYQPKFYYQRVLITTTNAPQGGKIVRKETLVLSDSPMAGFKLHPLFINDNNEELDYVLLPAYNGSVYDTSASQYFTADNSGIAFDADKLSSIAGVKPVSSNNNNLTLSNCERLAQNRGTGWHMNDIRAISATQMLFMTEFGSPNGQVALELGVSNINGQSNYNCSSITGSTSSLGNTTGAATSTTNEINGVYTNYSTVGQRAVSYRGQENPWGNIWNNIGGILVYGNGSLAGGMPYICNNHNYSDSITEDYESLGFCVPYSYSFISAFGYAKEKYDWVYMPIECSESANNLVPIGDCLWTIDKLNGVTKMCQGGHWSFGEKDGLFCYAGDKTPNELGRAYGTKLMFIPTINDIYYANVSAWSNKRGG